MGEVTTSTSLGIVSPATAQSIDGTWNWEYQTQGDPEENQTVTIGVTDHHGPVLGNFILQVENVAPSSLAIQSPVDGFVDSIDTQISFEAIFVDPGVADTHSATWTFTNLNTGGSTSVEGTVLGHTVTDSFEFAEPGSYEIILTVTDSDGDSGSISIAGEIISTVTAVTIATTNGNNINLESQRKLKIAVFSSASFSAPALDESTVAIGDPRLLNAITTVVSKVKDHNKDGLLDVVYEFHVGELVDAGAIDSETIELWLTAETTDGQAVAGSIPVAVKTVN